MPEAAQGNLAVQQNVALHARFRNRVNDCHIHDRRLTVLDQRLKQAPVDVSNAIEPCVNKERLFSCATKRDHDDRRTSTRAKVEDDGRSRIIGHRIEKRYFAAIEIEPDDKLA
ncbi:MAG: hypothetical protein ACREHD_19305 [Pirellulales bacterium]